MKLHEGQVIKNYKELCKLLDLPVKTGNSKKSQMKEIERYYKFRKEGYKFIVEEVYSEPLPKIDGRVNNGGNIANTKYGTLMDSIVINMLLENDGYMEESISGIFSEIDFFTEQYANLNKMGYGAFAETNNLGVGVTMIYMQQIYNIVKTCLETSLNRLQRNGVIKWEKTFNIRDTSLRDKLADAITFIAIKTVEKEIYKEMEITYKQRTNPDVNKKFKRKVCKELDILSYWNVYCIELIDTSTVEVEENKDELKRRLIKSIEDAVKKHKFKPSNTFGKEKIIQPYGQEKYKYEINKLTQLLWKLPKGYVTLETDEEETTLEYQDTTNTEEILKEIDYDYHDTIDYNYNTTNNKDDYTEEFYTPF